jgi:hypothetical protein
VPAAAAFVQQGAMSEAAFAAVLARAGYLTCPQTDLLPPGMPAAHKAIEVRVSERGTLGRAERAKGHIALVLFSTLCVCGGQTKVMNDGRFSTIAKQFSNSH